MKHKYSRFLLTFASGVVVGVIGVHLYGLFGKPTLPAPEIDFDKSVYIKPKSVKKVMVRFKNVGKGKPPMSAYDGRAEQFNEPEHESPMTKDEFQKMLQMEAEAFRMASREKSLEDTQPVKVMDWMKEW